METTLNIEELTETIVDKLFRRLKGEHLVSRKVEIANALNSGMVSVYEVGKLRMLGVGYHALKDRIKRGVYTEGIDYEETEEGTFFYSRRIKDMMNQ